MVNGTVSLISLSDLSFLAYGIATGFCALILYLETWPNPARILRILYVWCHVICRHGQFYFFSNLDSFLPPLITVARTSKTVLNESDENGHPCFVSDLRAFSFSPLSMMLALGYHIQDLLYWCMFPLYPLDWEFLSWKAIGFCQMLFLSVMRWSYDFYAAFC